jgi:hypothetical protein
MIGAPVPEAFIVVDVDPRNGGDLAELENLVGPIPPTLTVWSGRRDGGRHLYFQRPAGSVTSTRLPAGVDLKAAGYCIVPPSIHPVSGKPYTWVHRPVASMPAGLRELLRPPPPRRWSGPRKGGNAAVLVAWVERRGGNVNDAVYWAAKKAARDGVLDAIEDDLVRAADHAARAAGTWQASGERQTRRTIGSARRYVQNGGAR